MWPGVTRQFSRGDTEKEIVVFGIIDVGLQVFSGSFSAASVAHERMIVLVLFVETGMGCPTGRGQFAASAPHVSTRIKDCEIV